MQADRQTVSVSNELFSSAYKHRSLAVGSSSEGEFYFYIYNLLQSHIDFMNNPLPNIQLLLYIPFLLETSDF
jgi:hypothetical protein